MTARVERTVDIDVPPDRVWECIADPDYRAAAISVVADYETEDGTTTWHVRLPIPVVDRTVAVDTRDVDRDPPRYVKFVGRSDVMHVVGEHEIEPTDTGSRLTSRFTVDGRLPGVERFFTRNLDGELANLERALRESANGERCA